MTPEAAARILKACFVVPRAWSAEEITALLSQSGVFLIAEPSGFAIGRVVSDEAELLTLAVDPVAQRQGIGRRLLAEFLRECTARGAATVFLEVAATNSAARALYESAGFVTSGRRRGYFQHPDGTRIDALVLSRPAPPSP